MSVFSSKLRSTLQFAVFLLTFFVVTLSLTANVSAQSAATNIQVSNTVLQGSVHRLGVNLGDQTYWDSGQMLKNLVFQNPGFEGLKFRTILKCSKNATANSCQDDNQYSGQPTNFWQGATYEVMSGNSAGMKGVVVQSTAATSSCSGCGQVIQFDQSVKLAVGDYYAMTNYIAGRGDAGWWDNTSGGGTITTETTDLSPNTPGKQALQLSADKGKSVTVAQYFDSSKGMSFIQLNGTFQLTFRAKGVGGSNQLSISVQRLQGSLAPYLNQKLTLTNRWQDYVLNFSANETGSAVGTIQLVFGASGSNVELDDVAVQQTNSDPANTTVFRDDVVKALRQLNPGTIRMMAAGAALGSDIPNQLATPFARYRGSFSSTKTSVSAVAYGIDEFIHLCATVGADPWITVPTSTTPIEMNALILYLTGDGSDQYSASRIARGQGQPWTTVFNKIHIELGNETWNGDFKGESMAYPGYPQWANKVFGAARQMRTFQASKFDLVLDGWAAVPGYNQGLLYWSKQHDSIDIAPYLMFGANDEPQATMFGAMLAEPEMMESPGGQVYKDMQAALTAPTKTYMNVYETNLGTMLGNITQPELDQLTPSIGAGLTHTLHMLLMMRLGVQYQNAFALQQYQFLRGDGKPVRMWGIVLDMGTTNRRRPQFLTQAMANTAIAGNMMTTTHTGANPTWNQPKSSDGVIFNGAHYLQSFAFANGNTASLVVFNLSQTSALPVTFSGAIAPAGTVQMSQITSANITDSNEFANNVRPTSQTLSSFNAASGLSLPPFSMTVLSWTTTQTQMPQFSVAPGTYTTAQTVAMSSATADASIYYTTDGSTPTTASAKYNGSVVVKTSQTLHAIAAIAGAEISSITSTASALVSAVASAKYVIQPVAATPVISLASGTYTSVQTVTISEAVAGATIFYTTDGSTPTTSSNVYNGSLTVNTNETLNAIAVAPNYANSAIASAAFTIAIPAATPVLSVSAGTYTQAQTVQISTSTPGASIYYTTDGSTPTTSSAMYAAPVSVTANMTLNAVAMAKGYVWSPVASAAYTIAYPTVTPVLSVAGGVYNAAQTVGMTSTTPNATIYYTIDGGVPTTSSFVYMGPVTINASHTLQANAIATGYSVSPTASASYNLTVVAPTMSLPAGTYTQQQTVAISVATAGASIYYTTDGSTPTAASTLYTGPVSITANATVQAIGVLQGYTSSTVASAVYTIAYPAAAPVFSLAGGVYNSTQSVALVSTTPNATIYYTMDGGVPTTSSSVYSGPITISASHTLQANAIAPNYSMSTTASASYNLTAVAPTISLASGTYTGVQTVTIAGPTDGASYFYTTDGSAPTSTSNLYVGPIQVKASETLQVIATKTGYTSSVLSAASYTIITVAAKPVFSLASGSYPSIQVVALADTMASATIYYTTDGSVPTTASNVYAGPVTIATTTNLNAIAVVSGLTNSDVVSAVYVIPPPAATPTFSLAAGSYLGSQTVAINDASSGVTIYYTTDGTAPTTASAVYAGPITVDASQTVLAVAAGPNFIPSAVASANYAIQPVSTVFSTTDGFVKGQLNTNGSAKVIDGAVQLVNGGAAQAGTAWLPAKVGVSDFITDFDFQLPTSDADGFTFTIQNAKKGIYVAGGNGGALGYQGINNSVAIAFDLYKSGVNGAQMVGVYTGGVAPQGNSMDLKGSGVDLHSGDVFHLNMVYSGTTLTLTLTDKTTGAVVVETFTVNIPASVGAGTAYVGFTGSTGSRTSVQNILNWTYAN